MQSLHFSHTTMKKLLQISIIISFSFAAFVIFAPYGSTQTRVKTAGEEFKNIKVLNSMPADQMGKVMNQMTASLGVDCKFCHVSNDVDFEKEDSEHKATAREMLKMVFELNKTYFNGRPEINCNSCHKGTSHPQAVFPLAPSIAIERPKQPAVKPTVDSILDSYNASVGAGNFSKITSRVVKAIRMESDNKTSESEEIFQKGGKLRTETTYGGIVISEIFNGTDAWKLSGGSAISLHQDEMDEIRREAQFFGGADLRNLFTKFEYLRLDRIDGKDVYVVRATSVANQRVNLFFDVTSGFLVRRMNGVPTTLGNYVYQIDYSDYKDFGGVRMPTTIKFAVPNIYWTRKIIAVKVNAPVADSKFSK